MPYAYSNCTNLTTAACGDNVTNMYSTYDNCTNLTTAACGPNVISMHNTYCYCDNLTTAVCGDNVTIMYQTYWGCTNLTTAACGKNVTNMRYTYYDCPNIRGNAYFYSGRISDARNCFNGRNVSNRLNIYVRADTMSNMCLKRSNTQSLFGTTVTWTTDSYNNCFYNTSKNVYVYYVTNVEEARIANGD